MRPLLIDTQLSWAEARRGVGQLSPRLRTLPWYTLDNLQGHWATSHVGLFPLLVTPCCLSTSEHLGVIASPIDPPQDILTTQASLP